MIKIIYIEDNKTKACYTWKVYFSLIDFENKTIYFNKKSNLKSLQDIQNIEEILTKFR